MKYNKKTYIKNLVGVNSLSARIRLVRGFSYTNSTKHSPTIIAREHINFKEDGIRLIIVNKRTIKLWFI